MTEIDYEKKLEEVGEKMGQLMKNASPEEKERLKAMLDEINTFVTKEEQESGHYYDRSALFAAAVIADPDLANEELKQAAKEYIEIDYLFVKNYSEEEAAAEEK